MYCTRCGKKIDYDAFVCNECVKQEQEAFAEVKAEEPAPALEATPETVTEEPVADTTTAEPVQEPAQEPVNPQPTYTAPNNQQYYYSNPNTYYQQGAAQNSYQNPYQNNAYPPYTPYQPQPTTGNPRTRGLGKSIASTILGFFAYFFSAITLGVAETGEIDATIVFLMMTLGMAIPSLIMGIKSIKTFTSAPKLGLPRPIVTLVLGIVGLSFAAIGLSISLIIFMIVGRYGI